MVIVVMGVAGSGKSLIGQSLARALGWVFADGDAYHPPANVEKMSQGQPLTDEDRLPWLQAVAAVIDDWISQGVNGVMACSALKLSYRNILQGSDTEEIKFAYLEGSFELFQQRLSERHHHFMKSSMLKSQFQTLEPPQNAIVVDASWSPEKIVEELANSVNAMARHDVASL